MVEYHPFKLTYREFTDRYHSSPEKRRGLSIRSFNHWKNSADWFKREVERLNARFLVVGGTTGEIYLYSSDIFDFPDESALEALAKRTNEVPFAWSVHAPIEEIASAA